MTPNYEEDLQSLAELIGVERILFGSDWPHGEGLAEPMDFVKELDGFSAGEVQRIMRQNCLDLLGMSGDASS
jgi:predicted TIM-barrel fold metal-dependent hydrolase